MALPRAEVFEDEFPLIRSCPALNEIRLAEEIKDLTIEVKDKTELQAHRIILAARIPSLRATLSGPLGEANSVLRWPTMPLSLATTFLQYVYTGRVEMREDNAKVLVMLARMLELPHLVDWGVAFMARGLTLENQSSVWDCARSLNDEALTQKCIGLMRAQFEDFVPTDLFVRLPAQTLLTVLQSDDLPVSSEEQVIAAISRWVDAGACLADDDERLQVHAPAMFREVQWHQTTAECRDRLLENYPTFGKSPECLRLLLQISNWFGVADKQKRPCPFNIRPRVRQTFVAEDKDPTIFLFGVDKQDRWSVLRWNPRLQQAERVADMKADRWDASYSAVGESIFVVGGGGLDAWRRVDEFLVREGRWRERAPLAVGRVRHAAAVVKVPTAAATAADGEETLIGVFGGFLVSSCEVYDVGQDRWHTLPDLPEARTRPAAACLPGDSRVFLFGGRDERNTRLASVVFCHLRADWRRQEATSADFWQSAAPMRTARWGPAATAFRGAILVAGGWDGRALNTVEMFTPPDAGSPLGQWTELAYMQRPRCRSTLLTSANTVFATLPRDPPTDAPYTKLKAELLHLTSVSDRQRYHALVKEEALGDRKPSEFLRRMRSLVGNMKIDDKFFKEMFLERLPTSVQTILASGSDDLEISKLAEMADRMMEVERLSSPTIAQVSQPLHVSTSDLAELKTQIAQLSATVAALQLRRSPGPSRRSFGRDRRRSRSHPRTANLCWYHVNYGDKARRCVPPCSFKSTQGNSSAGE
nr:unnamed protein product [Spirometra erinaceieuropaei]